MNSDRRVFANPFRGLFSILAVGLILLLGVTVAMAQRLTGSASIQVQDAQGRALPGATATVTNPEKGLKLNLVSGSNGDLAIPDLAPGDYRVEVKHAGFSSSALTITIRVGVTTSFPLKLAVGSESTVVDVQASTETVDTEQSTVQNVVNTNQIESLPLNGRNFLALAELSPGVQIIDGVTIDPTKGQMVGVSMAGRSGRSTRIQVDGVDITDETVGTTMMNITNEAIQEFDLSQSSQDISTDLTSTGGINIITRSGGNTPHGSGFGLFRRSDFSASTAPLSSPTTAKPFFTRDNYGGRIGGPFIKDRWFWEAEYEKLQQTGAVSVAIPVADFSQFTKSYSAPTTEHMGGARTDYTISSNLKAFYRFNHDDNIGLTGFGGEGLSAFANSNRGNSHVAGLDYTSGSWTHSLRFSFLKFLNVIGDGNALAGTPVLPYAVDITGIGGFIYGPNANAPQNTRQENKQIKYDGTKVVGHHTVKFGVEFNKIDEGGFASFFGLGPRMYGAYTSGVAPTLYSAGGASDPLNYMLTQVYLGNGLGYSSEISNLGFPRGGYKNNRTGLYIHDNWKASQRFTINGGLRWDVDTGLMNADLPRAQLIASFDPELAQTPKNNYLRVAPQLGFAWDIRGDGKTVVRVGSGIYYETNIFNNLSFDRTTNLPAGLGNDYELYSPAGTTQVLNPSDGSTLFDFSTDCTGAQPTTGTPNSCIGASIGAAAPFVVHAQNLFQSAAATLAAAYPTPGAQPAFNNQLGTVGNILDPNNKSPYGLQFNAGIQRELRHGLVLSVDYVLNRGVHFNAVIDRNRTGAADKFYAANAAAALSAAEAHYGCTNLNCYIANGDPTSGGLRGGNIFELADVYGLGSGNGPDGAAAFQGNNPNFRAVSVIESAGLSRYQGLQTHLSGSLGSWGPFHHATADVSYAFSRFTTAILDQDFVSTALNNDNPNRYSGPAGGPVGEGHGEDRAHQLGISMIVDLPFMFRLASNTFYRSNLPSSIGLPANGSSSDIFTSDMDGDGTAADLVGNAGSFGRSIKANNINKVLKNFNANKAGQLTPAGQMLVSAGLATPAQMIALGAVTGATKAQVKGHNTGSYTGPLGVVQLAPAGQLNNPGFYTTDLRLSWRYKLTYWHDQKLSIEPMAEVFNLLNKDNTEQLTGTLSPAAGTNTLGSVTNTTYRTQRIGGASGSFESGAPRSMEFGVRVSF